MTRERSPRTRPGGQPGRHLPAGDGYVRAKELGYLLNLLRLPGFEVRDDMAAHILSFLPRPLVQRQLLAPFRGRLEPEHTRRTGDGSLPPGNARETLRLLWQTWTLQPAVCATVRRLLEQAHRKLASSHRSPLARRVREARETFRLSAAEVEILVFAYLMTHGKLGAAMDTRPLCYQHLDAHPRLALICAGTRLPPARVAAAVVDSAPLRRYGLLDEDLDLNPRLAAFLGGLSRAPLSSAYYREYQGPALPLASHLTVARHAETICQLIRRRRPGQGLHILLHGAPGTGKTELARSVAHALGYALYEIRHETDERLAARFRQAAFNACLHTVDPRRSLIVIDEADDLLNTNGNLLGLLVGGRLTGRGEKGLLNDLLDQAKAACVWITNRTDAIADSARRRFDYSVEFPEFTLPQRVQMWEHCLAQHRLAHCLTADEVRHLARAYRVNTGGIASALRNCRRLTDTRTTIRQAIERLLRQQVELLGPDRRLPLPQLTDKYSLDGLNLRSELPLPDCLALLRSFSQRLATPSGDPELPVRSLNLLLHGPPGTGKTEFAKYLAHDLGRELLVKRGSDLLNLYVGQTEKLIQAAFQEAAANGAILFLDEVDGLLGNRQAATHQWQVTQVNELLVAMESFAGLLICATNLLPRLDPAAVRRFTLKIEFDYLDPAGKQQLFARFFTELTHTALTPPQQAALERLPRLTPSDFHAVWQQHLLCPPAQLDNQRLLDALAAVARHRAAPAPTIGFGC